MNPQQPIAWSPTPANTERVGPSLPTSEKGVVDDSAFRAVLERLEDAARDLSRRSESLEDTKDLSGALQDAASSLDDALALRDSVLDAYRSAQQAAKTSEEDSA